MQVLIVDECDQFVFDQSAQFKELVDQLNCICMTATAACGSESSVENQILQMYNFSQWNPYDCSVQDNDILKSVSSPLMVSIDKQISANDSTLTNVLIEELQARPVIVYCSVEMRKELETDEIIRQADIIRVDATQQTINEDRLRRLDETPKIVSLGQNMTSLHSLVIVTDITGMRGFDYRGPKLGITLIVCAQFTNERDALQALFRVGRYGDVCQRKMFGITSLIDMEAKRLYEREITTTIVSMGRKQAEVERMRQLEKVES